MFIYSPRGDAKNTIPFYLCPKGVIDRMFYIVLYKTRAENRISVVRQVNAVANEISELLSNLSTCLPNYLTSIVNNCPVPQK